MKLKNYFFLVILVVFTFTTYAQESYGPTSTGMLEGPIYVPSIAEQIRNGTIQYADNSPMLGHPKMRRGNNVVPGKGFPKTGTDALVEIQNNATTWQSRTPILVFDADISQATPSDPTGAAGPNHYVGAWNVAFRIFDKSGNPLTAELSLGTLFPGNTIGDPIVFYDAVADRFVITEFDASPNGFNVAVCQGPDPVNDGWHIYTAGFGTGSFPDYTKFASFGDVYMVTANIGASNRVFAVERNEMLNGDAAQFVALPLPGIATSGFYSPHAFHTTDDAAAPAGTPVPIVYLQDDAWGGVADDHLKVWSADIDWVTIGNSSMSAAQQITTTDFISVFDGGSFSNLSQPGGPDIDCLQATMMNQVQYRRFGGYNSAVMNFVVDTDAGGGELAGVRWYELRQAADGDPWAIFQEGTYTSPDGKHAFAGSIAMNGNGDIGLGYSTVSDTDMIAIQYTGRLAADPLNTMTVTEDLIAQSTANNTNLRYADYTQLSVDPADDNSFWHIAEYFNTSRRDVVGHFELSANTTTDDIGITAITTPIDGVLTANEDVTISVRNFGINDISNPEVQYTVNGGTAVVENYAGTIAAGATESYTFSTQADLSAPGDYTICAQTNLGGDTNPSNDETCKVVTSGTVYCNPDSDCSFGDGFTNVTVEEIDNDSGCEGYADFTDLAATLEPGSTYDLTVTTGYGDQNVRVWIDFNDDGTFSNDETVISNFVIAAGQAAGTFTETVDLTIPGGETTGIQHRMRVKSNWQAPVPDDACEETQYGETEDYSANMGVLGVHDLEFNNSELVVYSTDNKNFSISLQSNYDGNVYVAVYNLLGQQLGFKNINKIGNSYKMELNLSNAESGVYIVKVGSQDGSSFKTERVIVK